MHSKNSKKTILVALLGCFAVVIAAATMSLGRSAPSGIARPVGTPTLL
jgi:hypothetical protein